jgi:hypothetical protein
MSSNILYKSETIQKLYKIIKDNIKNPNKRKIYEKDIIDKVSNYISKNQYEKNPITRFQYILIEDIYLCIFQNKYYIIYLYEDEYNCLEYII